MDKIAQGISSLVFRIYSVHPLSRIGWIMLGIFVLWTALAAAALRWDKAAAWKRLCAGVALVYMALLLYMTVMSRSETPYGGVMLRPLESFRLAREENREYYRTMLMNVFLFFPLGLTLPFGLAGRKRPVLLALGIGVLLSVGIETLQYVFTLGWAETDDVIMNALGVLLGGASYGLTALWERRRKTSG